VSGWRGTRLYARVPLPAATCTAADQIPLTAFSASI
jgi:hypothetical protein